MGDIKRNRSPDRKSQKERIREITDQLEAGIQELFDSDKYREYLNCMSKFHNYSLSNTLLIAMQRPDATLVSGYAAWQKNHGRTVKKGERGIRILAPYKYKVTVASDRDVTSGDGPARNGEEPKTVEQLGFKIAYVFDVSQTEGKELPDIGVNELTGDVKGYKKLFRALTSICPVRMQFEDITGGAKGYYNDAEQCIAIKEGMSQVQTIKTMIHEMAHQKLHAKEALDPDHPIDRRTKEVEAESIAYTVCSRYGLDTSDYSFGYVAGWSSGRDTKELKASLERIRTAADEMITGIDQSIEKQVSREKNRSRDQER